MATWKQLLYADGDGTSLSGIATSGHTHSYDNYSSWNLKTGGIQRTTVSSGSDLDIIGGTNVAVSYASGGRVTITSTDTNTVYTHPTSGTCPQTPASHTHSYLPLSGGTLSGDVDINSGNLFIDSGRNLYLDGGSNTYIKESSSDVIIFATGGTTALTLDSSQNATFAGALTVDGASTLTGNVTFGGTVSFPTPTTIQANGGTITGGNLRTSNSGGATTVVSHASSTGSGISWGGANQFYLYAGGEKQVTIANTGVTFEENATFAGDVSLAATKKLYLDGGSNTYIYESAGDTIKFVAGMGGTALTLTTLQATFSGSVQCGVNFKSSDGTSGANVVKSWEDPARDVHTVTIKDGLITSWVIA
jgi:hypothetical protein